MRIGYGKIGRSMPLTLADCGNLGGDVECVAVVKELALRHPDDEFILIGRNSGEDPVSVGLPSNVTNPWREWGPKLKSRLKIIDKRGGLNEQTQAQVLAVYDDLTLDFIRDLDGLVFWVGQHGTTNMPLPAIGNRNRVTKPHDWSIYYAAFLFRGINAWRNVDPWNREEIYLNADARNRHKMRDLKWPLRHPVLAQYTFTNNIKHERFGDPSGFEEWSGHDLATIDDPDDVGHIWRAKVHNGYARLEVNGLRPGTPFGNLISYDESWDRPGNFGLFINEARSIGIRSEVARLPILKEWVLPLKPHFIHGTWSDSSLRELALHHGISSIKPAPWDEYYPKLHSVKCTFTTPSSGSGWATAKPWEAFAAGTVCFFHPEYDTQHNILGDAPEVLRKWLRVRTPEELRLRVDALSQDQLTWQHLVREQRAHFDRALADLEYIKLIEDRLYAPHR